MPLAFYELFSFRVYPFECKRRLAMKKNLILSLIWFLTIPPARAETMSEAQQFGTLAGVALACGATTALYKYEEIVSRYFADTTPNETVEKELKRQYVRAKVDGYRNQKLQMSNCGNTLIRFTQMPLMQFQLFSDGSLKTPQGKYLLPRGQKQFNPAAQRIY